MVLPFSPDATVAPDGRKGSPPVTTTREQAIAALARGQEKIRSLEVAYDFCAEALDDLERVRQGVGVVYLTHEERTFAFSGNKRYYSSVPLVKGPNAAVDGGRETGFDGSRLRQRYGNQVYLQKVPSPTETDASWFTQDYPRALGLTLPDVFSTSQEVWRHECLSEALHQAGYEVEPQRDVLDGESCIVVSRAGVDRIWLMDSKGCALKRRDVWDTEGTKRVGVRLLNHDFRQVEPGVWLPWRCWVERCAGVKAPPADWGKPLLRYILTVQRLSINDVPDKRFTLSIEPGTFVVDATLLPPNPDGSERALAYEQSADQSHLDDAVRQAADHVKGADGRWRGLTDRVPPWLAVPAALTATTLGYVLWRRRHPMRMPPSAGAVHRPC
jgi:hypothetical protein